MIFTVFISSVGCGSGGLTSPRRVSGIHAHGNPGDERGDADAEEDGADDVEKGGAEFSPFRQENFFRGDVGVVGARDRHDQAGDSQQQSYDQGTSRYACVSCAGVIPRTGSHGMTGCYRRCHHEKE